MLHVSFKSEKLQHELSRINSRCARNLSSLLENMLYTPGHSNFQSNIKLYL